MFQTKGLGAAAELLRKGATLLKEPCPTCGGLQLRYRSRTLCTSHHDLSDLGAVEAPEPSEAVIDLKDLVAAKIRETSLLLKREGDVERQTQLATLLLKYVELMQKATAVSEKPKEP